MRLKIGLVVVALIGFAGLSQADQTKQDVTQRLQSATTVLHNLTNVPEKGIPDEVLKSAKCIAVVPDLIKGGFIIAGKHGRGVATCKLANGSWSAPSFFVISGGSWGAQIGAESIDLVMLVMTNEGMRHLMSAKFQMGGSASAALGPIGRDASAGTDWKVNTDFLTYSRSKGLFAGIDLGGSVVQHDDDSTFALYGKNLSTQSILDGHVPAPAAAHGFLAEVRQSRMSARAHS